jgi:peptide/nickel transport system permease protein
MRRTLAIAACALIPVLPLSYLAALALNLWPRMTVPLLGAVKGLSLIPTFLIAIGGIMLLALAGISLTQNFGVPVLLLALFPFSALTLLLHASATASPPSLAWRSALAQGQPDWLAFHRALFRPAAGLWLTAWITQFSFVIFVAMVVEVILTVDGCGGLLVDSIQRRDLPVVQGILLFNAVLFLLLQALSAFLQPVLDPRSSSPTQPAV